METSYAPFDLYKAIPPAVWGDVVRRHRVTGELVTIIDMSQVFILRFYDYVPIYRIISGLEQMPEVEYAHGPIQAVNDVTPNDDRYGEQWNLVKIEAPKAWDITKGSPSVVVGIIDIKDVNRNHPNIKAVMPVLIDQYGARRKFVPGQFTVQLVDGLTSKHENVLIGDTDVTQHWMSGDLS